MKCQHFRFLGKSKPGPAPTSEAEFDFPRFSLIQKGLNPKSLSSQKASVKVNLWLLKLIYVCPSKFL